MMVSLEVTHAMAMENVQMQGLRILRSETYVQQYAAATKDEA
jgi:hypothetical protein